MFDSRYRKQMEEMQKAFNKTIIKLQNTSRIAEEQVSSARAQMLVQKERESQMHAFMSDYALHNAFENLNLSKSFLIPKTF